MLDEDVEGTADSENDGWDESTGIFGLAQPPPMIEGPLSQDLTMPTGASLPTLIGVSSRLKGMLNNNDETVTTLQQRAADITKEMAVASEASSSLALETEASGDRYNFFQDLRVYLSSLADFFDEKLPLLVQLEEEFETFLAKAVRQRKETAFAVIDNDYEAATGLTANKPSVFQEAGEQQSDTDFHGKRGTRLHCLLLVPNLDSNLRYGF